MLTAERTIFTSVNPADTADVVGEFTAATTPDVLAALERAAAAQSSWAALAPAKRAAICGGIAHAIARQTRELAALITREEGKTLAEAQNEVAKSVEQFHFASQLAYLCEGTTYPGEESDTFTYTLRQPLGTVAVITPWNFPLSVPARKIAPALVTGNSVVFKPSPSTAAVAEALATVCGEAGLPDGVLGVVHGEDAQALATLASHASVRAISFTGSDAVGETLWTMAAPGTRLQFELGGHNAAVVCADADLARAAKAVAAGSFGLCGQACTATGRALVVQEVYEQFRELVAAEVRALRVGPGSGAGVTTGPVATQRQYDRLTALIASVADGGGRIVAAAHAPQPEVAERGWFVTPTVVEGLPLHHAVNAQEIFGPLLSLIPIATAGEGIEMLNADAHGLVAAVHTRDLRTAMRFAAQLSSGVVKVNRRTTGNGIAPPFGGWKASSSGAFPEGGRQALEFFTQTKTVYCGY